MVETIKYTLLQQIGKIEIRRYPRLILAKVDGYGDSGFNILFQYISGSNRHKEKISMTTPVISQRIQMTVPVISEKSSIAFVLPASYTLENTPEPLDERIQIILVPSRIIAALKFSGRWTQSAFDARSKELLAGLEQWKGEVVSDIFVMRYSGPFTPWFLRKNEVAAEVNLEKNSF